MPTYEIEMNGQQFEVEAPDDASASKAIQGLQGRPQAPQSAEQSTGMDMLKSAGSGVAQGALDLVGLPGTIQNAFDSSFSRATGDVASLWGGKGVPAPPPSPLSGEGLRGLASSVTGGATEYKPETRAGRYAQTAGAFVPGAVALGGSGGMVGNALKYGVVPGVTSEAAGQAAEKYAPSLEPYARIAGAVAGGLAPAGLRAMVPTADEAALKEIASAAAADNLTPEAMRQKLQQLGPEGKVADLGPNLQGQTGALANLPGPQNQTIRTALDERNAGANARITSAREPLGVGIVPSAVKAEIKQGQRDLGPLYTQVFENAKAVDAKPIADILDSSAVTLKGPAQKAVSEVRGMLDIPGAGGVLDPNPGALFEVRQAIDGMLKTETNDKVIQALSPVRKQIDEMLAVAVPDIKKVDAAYAELARQKEAVVRGQTVLDSGRTAPRPSELADEVAAGALPKGEQIGPSAVPLRLSQGASAEIDRILGNNANDVAALNRLIKGEGDWNRAKLSSLFGEEKTTKLIQVLDNEKAFADTRNFATGNSVSANRLQYQKKYGGSGSGMTIPEYYGTGGILGALRGAGVKIGGKLLSGVMDARSEAMNSRIAKALMGKEEVVDALLQQQLRGNRLAGPAKQALVRALLDQRRRLEDQ
jgi:hypothetical protein